jgi:hypothetical protein
MMLQIKEIYPCYFFKKNLPVLRLANILQEDIKAALLNYYGSIFRCS